MEPKWFSQCLNDRSVYKGSLTRACFLGQKWLHSNGFLNESVKEYDGEMPHNQLCDTNNLV